MRLCRTCMWFWGGRQKLTALSADRTSGRHHTGHKAIKMLIEQQRRAMSSGPSKFELWANRGLLTSLSPPYICHSRASSNFQPFQVDWGGLQSTAQLEKFACGTLDMCALSVRLSSTPNKDVFPASTAAVYLHVCIKIMQIHRWPANIMWHQNWIQWKTTTVTRWRRVRFTKRGGKSTRLRTRNVDAIMTFLRRGSEVCQKTLAQSNVLTTAVVHNNNGGS